MTFDQIFAQIAAGTSMTEIADRANISRTNLYRAIHHSKRRDDLSIARRASAFTLRSQAADIRANIDETMSFNKVRHEMMRADYRDWLAGVKERLGLPKEDST